MRAGMEVLLSDRQKDVHELIRTSRELLREVTPSSDACAQLLPVLGVFITALHELSNRVDSVTAKVDVDAQEERRVKRKKSPKKRAAQTVNAGVALEEAPKKRKVNRKNKGNAAEFNLAATPSRTRWDFVTVRFCCAFLYTF